MSISDTQSSQKGKPVRTQEEASRRGAECPAKGRTPLAAGVMHWLLLGGQAGKASVFPDTPLTSAPPLPGAPPGPHSARKSRTDPVGAEKWQGKLQGAPFHISSVLFDHRCSTSSARGQILFKNFCCIKAHICFHIPFKSIKEKGVSISLFKKNLF